MVVCLFLWPSLRHARIRPTDFSRSPCARGQDAISIPNARNIYARDSTHWMRWWLCLVRGLQPRAYGTFTLCNESAFGNNKYVLVNSRARALSLALRAAAVHAIDLRQPGAQIRGSPQQQQKNNAISTIDACWRVICWPEKIRAPSVYLRSAIVYIYVLYINVCTPQ